MTEKYANQEVSYLIIGAGIAGLTAAQRLQSAGFGVRVVDKGRGVGGRMATRRVAEGVFDHGAQFFSVRDPRFRQFVSRWETEGIVKTWSGGFPTADGDHKAVRSPRYRGEPGMTAIPKALAVDLDVRLATRIKAVGVQNNLWHVRTGSGEVYRGAGLIMTPPVPQSLALLEAGDVKLPVAATRNLQSITYHPCIALMVLLENPSRIPGPGGVRVRQGAVRWIADNQQKGISPEASAVTIHASPAFSKLAWDMDDEEVLQRILAEVSPWVTGPIRTYQVHRWRYAQPVEKRPVPMVTYPGPPPLIFAGDAFGGGRVEGAALTGLQAAEWLIGLE